jgi:hypothetical protein
MSTVVQGERKNMTFKPRSKTKFRSILKDLKLSKESKSIIADIGVQMDLAAYDAVKALRLELLATLHLVEEELYEHNTEYHHITSPTVRDAVRNAIIHLGGKPKRSV